MNLVLPNSTVDLIARVPTCHRHPGLQLDKFSIPGDQQAQKAALDTVSGIPGDSGLLASLRERRQRALESLPGANAFFCEATGPLTLHLSRASALENAGICLHQLYGFAYLPGSGLKGMARAYAETVWFPTQTDQAEAWRRIEDVFGWAPASDRGKDWKPKAIPARAKDDNARVGAVVFHDAWPTAWPPLIVDIVNSHHPDYYQHDDKDHPPGDWENPVPVYFLAVKPRTTFDFPLSKRRADVLDKVLDLARRWLLGALCHLGAGAKTNAGYGAFKPEDDMDAALRSAADATWHRAAAVPTDSPRRALFETTLDLVTPAFLAGAEQYGPAAAECCDLRPATLLGHLRWWWRTMHAGYLDVKTLRALEAGIWGDTRAGGAVRIGLQRTERSQVVPMPGKRIEKNKTNQDVLRPDPDFARQKELQTPPDKKTTQGLLYMSYGMDEMHVGQPNNRRHRYVLEPPAQWRLRLIARPTCFFTNRADAADRTKRDQGKPITAEHVLNAAKAALWLLCHFGAVGSKARKGFGSLAESGLDGRTREKCQEEAERLRAALGLLHSFKESQAHSSSLQQMLDPVDVTFSRPDVWNVLDQVGFAYQSFAKEYEHKREKMALGLPRRIGNPVQGTFNPKPPVVTNGRHSSPVHIHVARSDGGWLVRAVAFPAAHLPDLLTSTAFLKKFLERFDKDLQRRASLNPPPSSPTQASRVQRQQTPADPAGPILPNAGDRVEAVLLDAKTRKGGWKAKHEPTGLSGPIQNSADVPDDLRPGNSLELIVASASKREIAFRYPTSADEQRNQRAKGKPKGSSGGRR